MGIHVSAFVIGRSLFLFFIHYIIQVTNVNIQVGAKGKQQH